MKTLAALVLVVFATVAAIPFVVMCVAVLVAASVANYILGGK